MLQWMKKREIERTKNSDNELFTFWFRWKYMMYVVVCSHASKKIKLNNEKFTLTFFLFNIADNNCPNDFLRGYLM